MCLMSCSFFFNDTATTEIYTYGHTLSLHDALPICCGTISASRHGLGCRFDAPVNGVTDGAARAAYCSCRRAGSRPRRRRSEEHTSELQSLMRISYAVFCLKKNIKYIIMNTSQYDNNHIADVHYRQRTNKQIY